jgi:hypothetical protein
MLSHQRVRLTMSADQGVRYAASAPHAGRRLAQLTQRTRSFAGVRIRGARGARILAIGAVRRLFHPARPSAVPVHAR